MQIARLTPNEHSEFLNLVNAEIRPDRAKTNAWDDFPLILAPENRDWMLAIRDPAGQIVAGLACLIREYSTTCGNLYVAGIGSVVTRAEFRGRGFSSALQKEMLRLLREKNIPLAVLWTDEPEIYAGRGFKAAGWEIHVDLSEADLTANEGTSRGIRDFVGSDTEAVEALYDRHPLRTLRMPNDSRGLYGMPGTRGLVLTDSNDIPLAAVFCGKGADFPEYVTEWSGPTERVIPLLNKAKELGLARSLLVPAGAEGIVDELVDRGAAWIALPSGYWKVIDPDALTSLCDDSADLSPEQMSDPCTWLGTIDETGDPSPGPLAIAVWGFDSV
jgi:GNAT superfamily N-acetyltransferase